MDLAQWVKDASFTSHKSPDASLAQNSTQKKWPKGGAPKGGGAQNFAFFSLFRHNFLSFLPSLGLLVEVWCPVWWGRRVSHDSQRAHTFTFEVPALQTPPKLFPREDTQRESERTNFPAREGKERAKFWGGPGEGLSGGGGSWGRAALGKGNPGEGRPWVSLGGGEGGVSGAPGGLWNPSPFNPLPLFL